MQFLDINDKDFDARFAAILARGEETGREVEQVVLDIIADVRSGAMRPLLDYTRRFDRLEAASVAALEVTGDEINEAFARVEDADIAALKLAVERVARFHEKQKQETWLSTDEEDILLGQMVTPLERVGIYVPGGKASYPSSVIMNAVPAKVAGVGEMIMVAPTPGGEINPMCWWRPGFQGWTGSSGSAGPRPWRPWPTAPLPSPGWTRSPAPATSTWRPPRSWCSARSAST